MLFAQIQETRDDRVVLLRQVETYLSVTVAVIRALVVTTVAYIAWRILAPTGSRDIGGSSAAAIGASAFFVVFAGQTLGILLRDITSGALMIIEKWFNIGDFIKVEPFQDIQGVVERMTLRSVKLRSLSGEIVWIRNQQIQAVHVTRRALRLMAVDVFVEIKEQAKAERLEKTMKAIPTGPTLLARPLRMSCRKMGGRLVAHNYRRRNSLAGSSGWLKFFVNALKSIDTGKRRGR